MRRWFALNVFGIRYLTLKVAQVSLLANATCFLSKSHYANLGAWGLIFPSVSQIQPAPPSAWLCGLPWYHTVRTLTKTKALWPWLMWHRLKTSFPGPLSASMAELTLSANSRAKTPLAAQALPNHPMDSWLGEKTSYLWEVCMAGPGLNMLRSLQHKWTSQLEPFSRDF